MTISQIVSSLRGRDKGRISEAAHNLVHEYADKLSLHDAAELAMAVAASGDQIQLPDEYAPYADCPSTGGLGSLSTLLSPLLIAADGVRVPKISVDGSIAGAIDTLRLIPSFSTSLTPDLFTKCLIDVGIVHVEQTDRICPADRTIVAKRRAAGQMENTALAAISLLGKKLAISDCAVAFDFRVGPVGNIGESAEKARIAEQFFLGVAGLLNLRIAIVATDNIYPQCSSIGRVESLSLVWRMLNGGALSALDECHLDTCIALACRAIALARQDDARSCASRIARSIKDGSVRRVFERHLASQGSSVTNLLSMLEASQVRRTERIRALSDGRWLPPTAALLKRWLKGVSSQVHHEHSGSGSISADQVGIQLLKSPGEHVKTGEPVMSVALPNNYDHSGDLPPWGSIDFAEERPQIVFQ